MVRTSVLILILTAACGNNASTETDQQAAAVFFDLYGALEMVQQDALAAQPFAPVVQTIDFTEPCARSGSSTLHGTYDGDGTTQANYALDTTFATCVSISVTLDGAVQWTGSISGTDTSQVSTETFNGEIAFTEPTYAGTFAYHDLTITTTITGTTASVTVTGTFTVGGTTYSVDSSEWAAYFGG